MATSSITKDFRVKDVEAFERLKKDIDRGSVRSQVVESPSLKKSREKLATFLKYGLTVLLFLLREVVADA